MVHLVIVLTIMYPKKGLSKLLLKIVLYFALFGCFVYFFMKDQLVAFYKGRTTITKRVESVKSLEFPTITICFDPATKLSVSKKYGFKTINDKFNVDIDNLTMHDIFDEVTYQMGSDYVIKNYNGPDIKLGLNQFNDYLNSQKLSFFVEPIRTYNSGTCIKLEPRFEMTSAPQQIRLSIELNIDNDLPESILIILTSNISWIGLIDNVWPQFKPLKEKVDLFKEYTHLMIEAEEENFHSGHDNPGECLKNLFQNQNCSYTCNILSYPGLPPCQSVQQFKCIFNGIWSNDAYYECYNLREATMYSLNSRVENPYHEDKTNLKTDVYIGVNIMQKVIKEEVSVLTLQDLIGSVGGSLGLFFGFSFYSVIFACLNRFFTQ